MDNRADFTQRLQRLEARDTTAIARSTNVDSALAQEYGKKDKGMKKWFLLKAVLFIMLTLVSFRVGSLMMSVDLDARRAELQNGSTGEKAASVFIGSLMLADPWLLPMFGDTAIQQVGSGTPRNGTMEVADAEPEEPNKPSMVVNSVKSISASSGLPSVSIQKPGIKGAAAEPIPVAQSFSSKILNLMKVGSNKRPRLYFPKPSPDWFSIQASELSYEAKPYFRQKEKWEEAQKGKILKRAWLDLPLLKSLLLEKGASRVENDVSDTGWYVNEKTGEAIILKMIFIHDAIEPSELSKKIAKNTFSESVLKLAAANRARHNFKAAGVPYKKNSINSPIAVANLNFSQTTIHKYESKLSRYVHLEAWSTAAQSDVEALLSRIDYDTLRKIFK
jgi:hypothetical protein